MLCLRTTMQCAYNVFLMEKIQSGMNLPEAVQAWKSLDRCELTAQEFDVGPDDECRRGRMREILNQYL